MVALGSVLVQPLENQKRTRCLEHHRRLALADQILIAVRAGCREPSSLERFRLYP